MAITLSIKMSLFLKASEYIEKLGYIPKKKDLCAYLGISYYILMLFYVELEEKYKKLNIIKYSRFNNIKGKLKSTKNRITQDKKHPGVKNICLQYINSKLYNPCYSEIAKNTGISRYIVVAILKEINYEPENYSEYYYRLREEKRLFYIENYVNKETIPTLESLAEKLGVTKQSVFLDLKKLGLNRSIKEEKEVFDKFSENEIIEYYHECVAKKEYSSISIIQMSKKFKINQEKMKKIFIKYNFLFSKDLKKQVLMDLYKEHYVNIIPHPTIEEVGKVLNKHPETVSKNLKVLGLRNPAKRKSYRKKSV